MSVYSDLAELVTVRPIERPIEVQYEPAPFRAKWGQTVELLADELRAHGAERTVLEVDFREQDLRLDGLPRAGRPARSPGIVLSFRAVGVSGTPSLRYEVGTYAAFEDNVRGVALALRALRAVDRYGVTKKGEQYAGWRALAAGSGPSAERGRTLIRQHGSVRAAQIATHPDRGGDPAVFADVQAAIEAGAR